MPNSDPNKDLLEQYTREYQRLTQVFRRMRKMGYNIPEDVKPVPPSKIKNIAESDVDRLIKLTPQKVREQSYYVDPTSGEATYGLDVVKSHHSPKPSEQIARVPTGRQKLESPEYEKPKRNKLKNKNKKQPSKPKNENKEQTQSDNPNKKSNEGEIPPKESNLNMQIVERITNMLESWTPAPYWRDSFKHYKAQMRFAIMDKWNEAIRSEGAYQLAYRLENMAEYYNRLIDRVIHFSDSPWEDQINLSEIIKFLTGTTLSAEEYENYSSQAEGYIRDTIVGDSFG